MKDFDREEGGVPDGLVFALGAVGGFALGVLLSGRVSPDQVRDLGERVSGGARDVGAGLRERTSGLRERASALRTGDLRERASGLRDRARDVATRLSPGRLRRGGDERGALAALEDAVLDAFLNDDVLSERGIDVGAISPGIIELSGAVWTDDEADRAVRVAQGVRGVTTVVNRMDVEDDLQRMRRRTAEAESEAEESTEWTGRNIGMGRRRQGRDTDPDRTDDSHKREEIAMELADRTQYTDEGIAHSRPRTGERPEAVRPGSEPDFREDELDNQSPYAADGAEGVSKHGARAQPEQPQELNTDARVGEGPKPGTELRLEAADVPVKPHGHHTKTKDSGQ